jgi:hypothetical protein
MNRVLNTAVQVVLTAAIVSIGCSGVYRLWSGHSDLVHDALVSSSPVSTSQASFVGSHGNVRAVSELDRAVDPVESEHPQSNEPVSHVGEPCSTGGHRTEWGFCRFTPAEQEANRRRNAESWRRR